MYLQKKRIPLVIVEWWAAESNYLNMCPQLEKLVQVSYAELSL